MCTSFSRGGRDGGNGSGGGRGRFLIILALAMLTAGLAGASSASASRSQTTLFDASQEVIGDQAADCTPGGAITVCDQALDEAKGLGADSIRVLVFWRDTVQSPGASQRPCGAPGSADGPDNPRSACYAPGWGRYDAIVRAIASRGLGVVLVPTGKFPGGRVPLWGANAADGTDPDPTEYGYFTEALARRYSGSFDPDPLPPVNPLPRAAAVAIWNEANSRFQLSPQVKQGRPYAARLYRGLFKSGSAGLRAGGFSGEVWIGETAPRANGKALGPIPFLRSVLCLKKVRSKKGGKHFKARCGKFKADGWSHHPHTARFAPYAPPDGAGDVTTGNLPAMVAALRQAKAAGALRTSRLLLTEYGVQTNPPDQFLGVPAATQAEYLGIAEYLAYRQPRVTVWSQYLLRDERSLAGFQSGLRLSGGGAKPALAAFRTPLVARLLARHCVRRTKIKGTTRCVRRSRPRVRLWGEVRRTGTASIQIELRDRGGAYRPLGDVFDTDARGYFTRIAPYRRGRVYRLRWNDGIDGFSICPGSTPCYGPPIRAYRFR